jgi:hypothetical protein|tara:strand:+ start:1085 stop:1234 length:150 start_codon:yes stop_codon:yes gene_type:complete
MLVDVAKAAGGSTHALKPFLSVQAVAHGGKSLEAVQALVFWPHPQVSVI